MSTVEHRASYAVGDHVTAVAQPSGLTRVLAKVTAPGLAQCLHPDCSTPIQRLNGGDLADGVRAHYRTVHPARGVQ